MASKVRPIPEGYHTLTPYLTVHNADNAIEFYKKAFDATEIFRMVQADGRIGHAELKIGNSPIMLSDEFPEMKAQAPQTLGGTAVTIHLYVTDVDKVFKQALSAGAKEIRPVADQFFGDRMGVLVDPFGHKWSIATHKEDVAPDELRKRFNAMPKKH